MRRIVGPYPRSTNAYTSISDGNAL
jgi:hypothetical protein